MFANGRVQGIIRIPSARVNAWIKRHSVATLFVLAYGLTWLGLIPQVMAAHGQVLPIPPTLSVAFAVGGCVFASLIVVHIADGGKAGRWRLLRRYTIWRVGVHWYLLALFGPGIVFLAGIGLTALLRGAPPEIPIRGLSPASLAFAFAVGVVQYARGNWEELCWRGVALPRLQARYSTLGATLLLGVVETFWHLPYAWMPGHPVQQLGLPVFLAFTVGLAIIFSWVFNNTQGSLLIVTLFHAALGTWWALLGTPGDATPFYLMTGLIWIIALLLVIVYGPAHLSHRPAAQLPIVGESGRA